MNKNMKAKRFFAGFLAFVMIALMLPITAASPDADVEISTPEELVLFANEVNGGNTYEGRTVVLTADLSMGGESSPFTPIGTSSSAFKGTFDGGYHVISGLYIETKSSAGLFGEVNGGTIQNVVVKGTVKGGSNAAGIVGKLTAGTVSSCGNEMAVSGGMCVGGVVGSVNGNSTISGCYNLGEVTGTTGYIGGVTGQHFRAGVVENCYNAGTVTGPATVGGVVGGHKASAIVIRNCYNIGSVVDSQGNNNNIGSVVGAINSDGSISDCYYLEGSVSDSHSGAAAVSAITPDMLGDAFKADDDNINGGNPVLVWQKKNPDVVIGSYEDLTAFADKVNGGETYEGKLIYLAANIYAGGESNPFTPIGTSSSAFKGTFDGGYHVISGIYIETKSSAGLFGEVNGGTIQNVVVKGTVKGGSNAAGIVGKLTAGTVSSCGNEMAVSGGMCVGGVVGSVNGNSTISGCYNLGEVTGTTGYIGGVTGQHFRAGVVENCYNAGTVTGPATVGGVVGGHKASAIVIRNCYNIGNVVDSRGNNNNIGSVVGAISSDGSISDCYYLEGSVSDSHSGATAVSAITPDMLGDAFKADDDNINGGNPILVWQDSIVSDTPVRPAFIEKTELSAALAGYIKGAVSSAKLHSSVSGTLLGSDGFIKGASSTATDWMALAMGRFGYSAEGSYYYLIDDGTGYDDYLAAMQAYIEKTYAENNGILHSVKATEWHRAVVAIAALGGDPTAFGTYNGNPIDMIADGSYNCVTSKGPGGQGINGWIWGLISMDTGMYDVPENAKYTRETFIKEILKMQLTDGVNGNEYGGWVLGGYGSSSDVDITAMAIQALAPYYNDDTVYTYTNEISKKEVSKTVGQCVDEALDRLGTMMNKDGGFNSWNTNNVESISQVVVALCSLGINPAEDERFITSDGKTLLDGMLRFRVGDGGFCHILDAGWNSMATDQATYALVSYWRFENGMRSLYDMRDEWSEEERAVIDSAVYAIENLPDPSAEDYKSSVKSALSVFRSVPESERRYVSNYSSLAAAIRLVGGESELDTDKPYMISISVTKNPDKTRYYIGDSFDASGMVVTAVYSDGRTEEITDYKLSKTSALELTDNVIYITYGVLRTEVEIEVREKMPWDGEGTESAPYIIKTADDLVDLQSYIESRRLKTDGVYFRLDSDINMKNIADFKGIAPNVGEGFRGHFDGAGHSVWNFNSHINNASGFIGRLGDGAVVENLTIASGSLGGSYNTSMGGIAGVIVSNATATIRNCHNYAELTGTFGIGGILGAVEDGARAVIENCSNHGKITASYQGGGIIGAVGPNRWKNNGASASVTNCYNTAEIGGVGSWGTGGIIGSQRVCGTGVATELRNCYNTGKISGLSAGAIIGSVCESDVRFDNVYYLDSSCGRVSGDFNDDGDDTPGTITGEAISKTESEMKDEAFVSALKEAFASDDENINGGYPIISGQKAIGEEAPVRAGLEIGTAEELEEFAKAVNSGNSFKGKTVALTSNIDLSDYSNWTPIGISSRYQFDGTFDGQGYVIDNLYSTQGGLFGYVCSNAVIMNVGVASGEIGSEGNYASFFGGIAKWSNGADFINCFNGADIYAGGYSGGIVGTVRDGGKSIIKNCYNTGSIYGKDTAIGGIVGHLDTTREQGGTSVEVKIDGCYNIGYVKGSSAVAGIVGKAQDGHTVINCYNAGKIESDGENRYGAIAGEITSGNTISNCYYDSEISNIGIAGEEDGRAIPKTTAEMKSEDVLKALGDDFKEDKYSLVNNGYPILSFMKTEDADIIDSVIERIASIGDVTAESADAISAARAAYDELDDSLKGYVSNYETLETAEQKLSEIQSLAEAKASAKERLEAYKQFSDYEEAQQSEIAEIIRSGNEAIDSANDKDGVSAALADAMAKLDAVKTKDQILSEKRVADVIELINALGDDITLESKAAVKAARDAYNALSENERALVTNYLALESAESEIKRLENESAASDTTLPDTKAPEESDTNAPDTSIPGSDTSTPGSDDTGIPTDTTAQDRESASGTSEGASETSAAETSGNNGGTAPGTGDSIRIVLYISFGAAAALVAAAAFRTRRKEN